MKAHLLFEDQDLPLTVKFSRRDGFTVKGPVLPVRAAAVVQDLELGAVLRDMAGRDKLISNVAKWALLSSLTDPGQITYRQRVLFDFIAHPDVARELYAVATSALVREREIFGSFLGDPPYLLQHAVRVLQVLVPHLKQLRKIADEHCTEVVSEGLTALFSMFRGGAHRRVLRADRRTP
jgi:hypothetical protein